MTISFNQIPTNLRVPMAIVEFDSSKAQQGPSLLAYKCVIIGQKLAAGSAAANSLHRVTREEDVITLAGRGSMLHRQYIAWSAANKSTEVWIGVLADNGAGVAATGTITVTGPATAGGTIPLYLGGELVEVGVNSGDIATAIATAIAAEINDNLDLPVTAAVGGVGSEHIVTLTFRHKGLVGNSYDIRHSFNLGEALPAGVDLAIVAMANGTTNPTLTTLIAAMADMWFHVWTHPYTDATSLAAIEAELADRAGPMRSMDGVAITSASGSFATLTTLGDGRNSAYSSIVAQAGPSPLTPPMEFAAEAAALVAYYGQIDPARPFQTLAMSHAIAPAQDNLFTAEERNLLLYDGIATTKVGPGFVPQLERIITTYQENSAGAADTAYLDVTTVLTLMYLRYDFVALITSRYGRHKLADDGARVGEGQAVITPKLGKGEALAWFRAKEEQGLVEGYDQFKRDLVCVRSGSDVNRLEWLLPTDLMNFLAVAAAKIEFRQ
jgi:phage tail sheath gpL-like